MRITANWMRNRKKVLRRAEGDVRDVSNRIYDMLNGYDCDSTVLVVGQKDELRDLIGDLDRISKGLSKAAMLVERIELELA